MKDEIQQIKSLLDKIESNENKESNQSFKDSFELFELPEIVQSIIDYLQPLLLPYESAIYWYLFRNSILRNGDNNVRVSTRGLGKPKTVVKSASGKSEGLSYGAVQDALTGLETKGTIKKIGDTNREGTLYRIYLPEEIELCTLRMNEMVIEELPKVDPKKEIDYYNVRENRFKIFERDKYLCYKCGKQLTRFSATLDHIQPVSKGGDNSFDNLVTACLHCNSRRGAQPIMNTLT
jgi:5-methylcytosine-specific restriction endonuclease McrA